MFQILSDSHCEKDYPGSRFFKLRPDMARPRKGAEMDASFTLRCTRQLVNELNRLASIAGISTNEYARLVLEHAVSQDVLPIESLEDRHIRTQSILDRTGPIASIRRTLLFRSQVDTFAANEEKMRKLFGQSKLQKAPINEEGTMILQAPAKVKQRGKRREKELLPSEDSASSEHAA